MFLFEQQINFSICWFMCCFKSNQIPNNLNQKYTKYTRTSSFKIQRMICYQTVKLLINQVLEMITLLCLISLLNNRILIGFDRGVQNKKMRNMITKNLLIPFVIIVYGELWFKQFMDSNHSNMLIKKCLVHRSL